jgi:hypothetical protein
VDLADEGGSARLYSLFGEGRFVLLEVDGAAPAGSGPASDGLEPVRRVRYRRCHGARLPAAALVRPDGYIAWASDERDPAARAGQARAAVRAWCSPA